ncbi:MAG: hypothetical protein JJT99_10425 [Rhodobacteraceae bacterium]|nr:hypothetical protein [Paracoccaceae bacterium]
MAAHNLVHDRVSEHDRDTITRDPPEAAFATLCALTPVLPCDAEDSSATGLAAEQRLRLIGQTFGCIAPRRFRGRRDWFRRRRTFLVFEGVKRYRSEECGVRRASAVYRRHAAN